MKSEKLGSLFILLGILIGFLHEFLSEFAIVFTLSIPVGMVLGVLGIYLLAFQKPIYWHEILGALISIVKGFRISDSHESKALDFISKALKEGVLPEQEDVIEKLSRSIKKLGLKQLSVDNLRTIMENLKLRRQFAGKSGIYQEDIDRVYIDLIANEKEKINFLLRENYEQRRSKKSFLAAAAIVLPIIFVTGIMLISHNDVLRKMVNWQMQERLFSLVDNRRFALEDYDEVRAFIKFGEGKPLYQEIANARDILDYIFDYPNQDSISTNWRTAYTKFSVSDREPKSDSLQTASSTMGFFEFVGELIGTVSPMNREKVLSYTESLLGQIAARYTSYGTYDTVAIEDCLYHYSRALQLEQGSHIAYTGIALALKYKVQHTESSYDSLLTDMWLVSEYLDSALKAPSVGLYQRARISNNKADLILEISNRLIENPDLLSDLSKMSREESVFWLEIKTLTKSGLEPLLDTTKVFINDARLFYPLGLPEILVTRGQIHALKAKYFMSIGNTEIAKNELFTAKHLCGISMARGLSDPTIFFAEHREMHYLDVFSSDWASEALEYLKEEVRKNYGDEVAAKI